MNIEENKAETMLLKKQGWEHLILYEVIQPRMSFDAEQETVQSEINFNSEMKNDLLEQKI